jgi:hypothetical protein
VARLPLKMEVIHSSETSVHIQTTWRYIPQDGTIHTTVVRTTCRARSDELIGGWRKVHNKELHNLYSSSNISRMAKSKRMRWEGMYHELGGGGKECIYVIGVKEATKITV